VDLLDRRERVGGAEDFGAMLAERDVDGGGVLAVDGGEAVGMRARPEPIVCVLESPLGIGQPLGEGGVVGEQGVEPAGELPR
jgi:hypothetical protein